MRQAIKKHEDAKIQQVHYMKEEMVMEDNFRDSSIDLNRLDTRFPTLKGLCLDGGVVEKDKGGADEAAVEKDKGGVGEAANGGAPRGSSIMKDFDLERDAGYTLHFVKNERTGDECLLFFLIYIVLLAA
ncbi:hypothetical protein VE00_05801 [Pseudogymnoascus sp. WSF 3629]|nr:hypothetical protein VE00_05801 [Pseudogymnoascus sp. WSF 3629]